MYTIREAAARSRVSIPLLRAWERRYGIVVPARTAARYRLYDDTAIERIRTMRRLVDAGWAPSTAAAAILSGESIAVPDRPDEASPAGRPREIPTDVRFVDAFVDAAAGLDAERLEQVLDWMFGAGSFETVVDGHVLPALVAIGDAWADGRLDVAAEHAASQAVLRRLAAAYQAAGRAAATVGAVLVGLPPSARHELGALAFSTAARRAGLPVLYLGPDLPVADWVAAARRTSARAAVIGVVVDADAVPAGEVAAALRADDSDVAIFVGGRSAARADQEVGAGRRASVLPDGLRESVSVLEVALRVTG
ncbi:MAG: cobalamin-dependent protein [Candidatus Limnocylindrales bacterium]